MGIDEDDPIPDSLSTFVDRKDPSEWSVQLANRTGSEPMKNIVENLFGSLDMEMQETEIRGLADDLLLSKTRL